MTAYKSLTVDQIKVGDLLPKLEVPVTATTVAQGAAATRDWQPQHHDYAWARRVGTQDIFLNTPTQGGWVSRYITDWSGPTGRLARLKYRMKASIYPGDRMVLSGTITAINKDSFGHSWLDIVVDITVGDALKTSATVTVALPEKAGAPSPWSRDRAEWRKGVQELPPFPKR